MVRSGIVCVWGGDCEHTNQRLSHAAFACGLWQPFQDMTFRGRAAVCGMVFCPVALNSEHAGNIFYQGLHPIRGSMICKTGIDISTIPNRRTFSEFI